MRRYLSKATKRITHRLVARLKRYGLMVPALLLFSAMMAQAQVARQDSLALVALYNATDGPNWADNTNWLTGPVSQWYGVSVSGEHVTGLDLIGNRLTGPIPGALGDLGHLEILFLNDNGLTGPIPVELGTLTNLGFLLIEANTLTGPIPAELGNLTRLTRLRLGSNSLSESIPAELGHLDSLLVLTLNDNDLTGAIPAELGNLENLVDLFLFANDLTGAIPAELGNLENLGDLRLSDNRLTGPIPAELGNLSHLVWLYLSGNQLTGAVPPELGSLASLRELLLNNNPLRGTLPLSLTNLSMLTIFRFDGTSLCESVDEAFQTWLQGIAHVESTGCTNVATEETADIPVDFGLRANYPNPFKLRTTIRYALPETVSVELVVYDALGRRVRVLVDERRPPGWYEVVFEADDLPSGLYFYHIEAGSFRETGPMVLVK